jgi:hypothetical protein
LRGLGRLLRAGGEGGDQGEEAHAGTLPDREHVRARSPFLR